MSEKKEIVSYVAFEGEMTRLERMNHRLFILCLVLILALVGTNAIWVWYESQFEYYEESVVQEVTQDTQGGGVNKFVGGDYYGEAESQDNENH